jgi:hypothetical protein
MSAEWRDIVEEVAGETPAQIGCSKRQNSAEKSRRGARKSAKKREIENGLFVSIRNYVCI